MRHNLIACILLPALFAAMPAAAQETVPGAAPKTAAEEAPVEAVKEGTRPVDPAEVSRLVGQLASETYAARETAEKRLAALGKAAVTHLDPLLATTSDPEVLARLKRVYKLHVPESAYRKEGEKLEPGFLGVRLEVKAADDDERLTGRQWGVRIVEVVSGTAAEEAGLQAGDLIIKVDGETFEGNIAAAHFVRRIQRVGAGGQVSMEYYRRKGINSAAERTRRVDGGGEARPDLDEEVGDGSEMKKVTVTLRSRDVQVAGQARVIRSGQSGDVTRDEMLAYRWTRYWKQYRAAMRARYAPPKPVGVDSKTGDQPGRPRSDPSNGAAEPAPSPGSKAEETQ
jgi:membrane-associated protease RseP (regulator of RpoE activity)